MGRQRHGAASGSGTGRSIATPRLSVQDARARFVSPDVFHSVGLSWKRRRHLSENDHPKGALVFMLVYLALLAFMWTNMYLKLWTR
jgi:hypothetical protein